MEKNFFELLNSLLDAQEMAENEVAESSSGSIFPDKTKETLHTKPVPTIHLRKDFPVLPHARTDVFEKNGIVTIQMDLPGFTKDEITVSIDNGMLTVEAKKDEKTEDKDKHIIVSERHSAYSHAIKVPSNRVPSDFTVHYDNGVLDISYEKVKEEEKKNTRIEIQ